MIRGNEPAIDLALGILEVTHPGVALTLDEIAAYIDAAREILNLPTKPFRWNDLWYLEHRALRKMFVYLHRQKIKSIRDYRHFIEEQHAA